MKKHLILIIFLSIITESYAQFVFNKEKIYGNGQIITEERSLPDFNKLSVTGAYDVKIVPGKTGLIKVTADKNLMQAIDIFVKSGKLIIRTHPDFNIRKYSRLQVEVPAENLSAVFLTGSGSITQTGFVVNNNIKLYLTGSGDMKFELNNNRTTVGLTGTGDIILKGKTDDLKINLTGTGKVTAHRVMAQKATVKLTGTGEISVQAVYDLVIKIFGSGDVFYYGEPTRLKVKTFGSGEAFYKDL